MPSKPLVMLQVSVANHLTTSDGIECRATNPSDATGFPAIHPGCKTVAMLD